VHYPPRCVVQFLTCAHVHNQSAACISGESVAGPIIQLGDRQGRKNREEAAIGSRYAYLYLGTRVPVKTSFERLRVDVETQLSSKPAEMRWGAIYVPAAITEVIHE